MSTSIARSDVKLQKLVQDELAWEPRIDSEKIGVGVDDGVVSLSGNVKDYFQKWEAEAAAKRVRGVKAVANELRVNFLNSPQRDDASLARYAAQALDRNAAVPADRVVVGVSDGWITLSGEVDLFYQKEAAEGAVRVLAGVRGVTNDIRVKAAARTEDVRRLIRDAFRRSASLDAQNIDIEAADGVVTLRGHVHSWAEYHEAERAASSAPGVTRIVDLLVVCPLDL